MLKTNTFKYIFFGIVIIMTGLAIYLLYKDGKTQAYATENKELEINMVTQINIGLVDYDTINPILSNNRDVQYIDKLIFEPLLDITIDFKVENKLAKEFSKINDTTYIVKLKEDVYWHDGEKFTAEDVIFTINNLQNVNINSIYKENVEYISELQKIDDYTVKIILGQKVDFFEYMMCIPILASHAYDANTFECITATPVGTGKFKITNLEQNNIIIEKSKEENESKITEINLILKGSSKELYMSFLNNEIDYIITDNIEYENYIGTIGYNVTRYTNRKFDYLVLNNQNTILSDKEIRKAINYAIDKNQIIHYIYNDKYNVSEYPLQYGSYLYDYEDETEYDTNKSKNILLENGWVLKNNVWIKGNKKLEFDLLVNSENKKRVLVAENIKEQLNEIGISINIMSVNSTQFNKYIKNNNYDIILTGNIVSNSPRLTTYFEENNLSNFVNENIENILKIAGSVDNQEENLKEKYKELKDIYNEEIPFIGLYFNSLFIITNKNLKGDFNGNWYNIFYNIDNWYKI